MKLQEEIKEGIACDSVGHPHSIVGRAVCLSVHPGKMMLLPFRKWFNKRYKGKFRFARIMFSLDLILIGTLIGLGVAALFFGLNPPTSFEDDITFEATVAPLEITSGAPSTLVIRYTNNTDEELRDAKLQLTYPNHFLLQELTLDNLNIDNAIIPLGTIPIGESGAIHIKGVMFGNVGGEQSFTSTLTFLHGTDRDLAGKKTSVHTFSPTSSTLQLALQLPERLIAFQEVDGTITYENTGEIDFPTISIQPEWPEGFSFLSSPISLIDGSFNLPAIKAGESGELSFSGYLGDAGEEVTFIFHPSFLFDGTRYQQKSLTHTAPVIPPQIRVEHSVQKTTIQPGTETRFIVSYENTGEFAVSNLVLSIESDSPFFPKNQYASEAIDSVAPGESGTIEISVPLRSSILQSETTTYEGLNLSTRVVANYTLGDGTEQRVSSKGSLISSPITTPVVFDSFGRYATASGDQLGRGPLPPRVGIETKYWIFWHVGGTINALENVQIEGTLAEGVQFTGRQSTSQNSGVTYDPVTNTMSWSTALLEPSLSPVSKIVGIAFELGITPTETMTGTSPVLMYDVRLTGTDVRTGAFVSRSGLTVTTNLPGDLMADGKSLVEN
ncbi:hypothetical protein COV05_00265 [Candidatus Uhrbacteria bacterium CG10_big_fil_rev_8_21_14_0_10_48_16]|uniref:DUF11 domain-containing protein n=1 Tax=Candidatus Uhrbacteria bacterium CG10_big_fil_rev_8_21_14_0_10_48_16 TaxID=1975038 RepID=A0A2M8LIL5_9BACT|nr:MAG: hypothetical protein COV05_00265 [Candidatus Uhrbacteria bacterium CG10_big_fil_rev_8_21_14_0_10_48_16]